MNDAALCKVRVRTFKQYVKATENYPRGSISAVQLSYINKLQVQIDSLDRQIIEAKMDWQFLALNGLFGRAEWTYMQQTKCSVIEAYNKVTEFVRQRK